MNEILLQPMSHKRKAREIICDDVMASLQLFAGETTYATDSRRKALKALLGVGKAKVADCLCTRALAEYFPSIRGLDKLFPYSHLEAVSDGN